MARKTIPKANLNDKTVKQILAVLLLEFRQKGLGSQDLHDTYEGMAPAGLKIVCCSDRQVPEVDFDFAMKDLYRAGLVKTGPMEVYKNDLNSLVVFASLYSKNEYTYLTEDGYKVAVQVRPVPMLRPALPNVHISGGMIHNSPVGIGDQVQQTISIKASASAELFDQLRIEVTRQINDAHKRDNALARLNELETAQEKSTKLDRYNHFVGNNCRPHDCFRSSTASYARSTYELEGVMKLRV